MLNSGKLLRQFLLWWRVGLAIGTGASAGAGAAGALGNIGQLYQLAQAALQLTGTGVGIANQASER
ncbi:unnamed protein product [Meloidogyne enterolobii]|uniref:Uncharacterized protein n=1 Tax=Meloidogyne enterolobii TaxID=390850 RepID=A0ACB0YNY3_MELEN